VSERLSLARSEQFFNHTLAITS